MRHWLPTVFHNARKADQPLTFGKTGVAIQPFKCKMTYSDFDDDSKIWSVYLTALEHHLCAFLGAKQVRFFRYGIRKRHAEFPISTGKEYEFAQPTSIAHVDATLASTRDEMDRQFGDESNDRMTSRFQWVNVWKPLRGPVNDWPLCFCDASTVAPSDLETTDMVYPDYHTENLSLRFNEGQKWYYLSDHSPDEIIVFKQSDSDPEAVGGGASLQLFKPACRAR